MDLQIDCINKTDRHNPHERIQFVGGFNPGATTRWRVTQAEAIHYIERGEHTFYTMVDGNRANVIVAKHKGNKYIKTENDGDEQNNLLSLTECSKADHGKPAAKPKPEPPIIVPPKPSYGGM
jgi:hypothetical protein